MDLGLPPVNMWFHQSQSAAAQCPHTEGEDGALNEARLHKLGASLLYLWGLWGDRTPGLGAGLVTSLSEWCRVGTNMCPMAHSSRIFFKFDVWSLQAWLYNLELNLSATQIVKWCVVVIWNNYSRKRKLALNIWIQEQHPLRKYFPRKSKQMTSNETNCKTEDSCK